MVERQDSVSHRHDRPRPMLGSSHEKEQPLLATLAASSYADRARLAVFVARARREGPIQEHNVILVDQATSFAVPFCP
jgi:hypothetical protein